MTNKDWKFDIGDLVSYQNDPWKVKNKVLVDDEQGYKIEQVKSGRTERVKGSQISEPERGEFVNKIESSEREYKGIGGARSEMLEKTKAYPTLNEIPENKRPNDLQTLIGYIETLNVPGGGVSEEIEDTIDKLKRIYENLPKKAQRVYVHDEKIFDRINYARNYFERTLRGRLKRWQQMPGPMEAGPANYPTKKLQKRKKSLRNALEEYEEKIDRVNSAIGGAKQRALQKIGSSVAEQTEKKEKNNLARFKKSYSLPIVATDEHMLGVGEIIRINKKSVTFKPYEENPRKQLFGPSGSRDLKSLDVLATDPEEVYKYRKQVIEEKGKEALVNELEIEGYEPQQPDQPPETVLTKERAYTQAYRLGLEEAYEQADFPESSSQSDSESEETDWSLPDEAVESKREEIYDYLRGQGHGIKSSTVETGQWKSIPVGIRRQIATTKNGRTLGEVADHFNMTEDEIIEALKNVNLVKEREGKMNEFEQRYRDRILAQQLAEKEQAKFGPEPLWDAKYVDIPPEEFQRLAKERGYPDIPDKFDKANLLIEEFNDMTRGDLKAIKGIGPKIAKAVKSEMPVTRADVELVLRDLYGIGKTKAQTLIEVLEEEAKLSDVQPIEEAEPPEDVTEQYQEPKDVTEQFLKPGQSSGA